MPTFPKTIGVIGLGSIGMRHAKNLLAMGHHVFGTDTDSSKRNPLREIGGTWNNQGKIWECDGVIIASPSGQHGIQTGIAVSLRIPVLVEKPIGVSGTDAEILSDLLQNMADKPVMVGNNLRFHSCVKKAKEWLDAGLIGTPLWANFTLAQYNDKYTDDVILNWGAHELDLARYLLGTCIIAQAVGDRKIADIILVHANECQTTVHLDYMTEPETRNFRIQGVDGFIAGELTGQRRSVLWYAGQTEPQIEYGDDSFDENYIEEMQEFIARIDGAIGIGASGEDGLAVLELILEAKKLAGIG